MLEVALQMVVQFRERDGRVAVGLDRRGQLRDHGFAFDVQRVDRVHADREPPCAACHGQAACPLRKAASSASSDDA